MTMTHAPDTPGVIAPPPLIALAAVLIGPILDWLLPAYVLAVLLSFTMRIAIGVPLIVAGCALALTGRNTFVRIGTNVNPYQPVLTLVIRGVFAQIRNPMYVGLILISTGIGIASASDWTVVMTVLLALTLHFGVILREERLLEEKFGEAYRQYKMQVPRYGLPF
jgi:protein-S-isoprenylcysteine O-methyltransferase Ste14